jgi:UDP-N-acetylglucosamine/UDP-N-acetylgalactosamine diphosphorylase
VCDPVFVGHHLRRESEFSLKVVAKRDASEKVGVFALVNDRPGIVEYSDLPTELRDAKNEKGALLFGAGSIAIHLFSLAFVERIGRGEVELPYHVAKKKVPYVDDRGELAQPAEPNGIKFELFVFDGLPFARHLVAMEVDRNEEFAPLKNRSGEDSPETCERAQSELFRGWLAHAGIDVLDPEARIEIGPLLALDREELAERLKRTHGWGVRKVLLD